MATATKIQLIEFNKDEALNGASLAFSSNGQLSGTVSDYVLNFQLKDIGSITERYSGQVQKKMYYFDDNGICSDGNRLHNLFIVDAKIIATSGTVATRGGAGTEENIDIDVLQPREYFAMYALQGILTKIDNPLLLDDSQVTLISNMAFKIAQSMMSTAVDYRAATKPEATPPSVDIDINNVTSTTDRILYNVSQSITNLDKSITNVDKSITNMDKSMTNINEALITVHTNLKDIKNVLDSQGGSVQKVELSSVSVSEVPVMVANNYLNTHVNNMPTVPSEPVSITGTVSVNNFPSSGGTES